MKKAIWKDVVGFEDRYQISDEGSIRTPSKKAKKAISDSHGNSVVILDDIVYRVDELVSAAFNTTMVSDSSDQLQVDQLKQRIAELESALASQSATSHRSKYTIYSEDDTQYASFAKAASAYGFNYDKFYNAFYYSKESEVVFEGIKFRKEIST